MPIPRRWRSIRACATSSRAPSTTQQAVRPDRAGQALRILARDLSQEEGELTPSLKVKRNVVYKSYATDFAALYDRKE